MPTPRMICTRLSIATAVVLVLNPAATRWCVAQTTPAIKQMPPFTVIDSIHPSNEVLQNYIRSLSRSFLTDHASSELSMLDAGHTSQLIRVEPVDGNYLITADHLRSAGRILARIVNRGADSVGRFGIPPKGKTYVWVQYVGGAWKGVLISTDSLGAIVGRSPVRVTPEEHNHPRRMAQAMARFITDSTTALVVAPCMPGCMPFGWCRADSLFSAVW